MKLCNYNYNIMSLNLFGIVKTTFNYEYSSETTREAIIISPPKYSPMMSLLAKSWEKIFMNSVSIAVIAYELFPDEGHMLIEFSG